MTQYDVGEKSGLVKTTIEFALLNEELRDETIKFIEQFV